jgi:phytoene dehydrogenase-like protein
MARSAQARGAVIRTEALVASLIVEGGRATGVRLGSGERIWARVVAANVPPKLLFRDLVPEGVIDPELRTRFVGLKSGSGALRMNVALAELPDFTCRPGTNVQDHHGSGIIIGPTLDYLERAYLEARLDGWSRRPVVEMVIPSTLDATLAPAGKHVASLFAQYAAPQLPDGRSWDDAKQELADLVIETVNARAPNFKASVIGRQVLSPLDLERRFGMVDGDIFHGQLTLNQLFSARPVLGWAAYRMPLPGLHLCGAGAHPGGGVTGLPGRNAAVAILRGFR